MNRWIKNTLACLMVVGWMFGAAGCSTTALIKATEQGDMGTVQTMLTKGGDINELGPDSSGRWNTTPLAHAAKNGHTDVVKLLIGKGANLNTGFPPPLAYAALYGQNTTAKVLIENGADINHAVSKLQSIINDMWVMHDEARNGIELIKTLEKILREQWRADDDANFLRIGKLYRGEEGGIGVTLKMMQEEIPVVMAVAEGGSAAGAGIKVGDKFVRIGDKATKGLGLNELTNLVVGPVGTEVKIAIMRDGFDKSQELTVTRAKMKYVLSEEVRKHKVQAEFAVQEKQFDKAVELYGKALEIAPWWPEGHFNRALILGETKNYEGAMREMKRYLLLMPDASNARAAQDKIYMWESKVK